MKVLIECEEDNELEVVIRCNKIDDEVRRIISLFEDKHFIIGKLDNRSYQIKIDDIYYLEANEDRAFIYCEDKGMPGNGIPFVEMLFFYPASDLSW